MPIYTIKVIIFHHQSKFNTIFIFLFFLRFLLFSYPLRGSDKLVASYLFVDSLGGEIYFLFTYLFGRFP